MPIPVPMPAPETILTGGAAAAGITALGAGGFDSPETVGLAVMVALFGGVVRQLMQSNTALRESNTAFRLAAQSHVDTMKADLREIRARNRPLLREHLDWRKARSDLRAQPSPLEMELSGVQASASRVDERPMPEGA